MFSHLRRSLGGNALLYQKAVCTRTVTKCSRILDDDLLPVPSNVDVSESTRFSPRRNREISATVIVSQNYKGISPSQSHITVDNYGTIPAIKHDPHVQSYDCFGTVNLNSAMQSNVPSPFGGMHKFSHLNMPRGQWSQESKFTSQNLQNSHYTVLRRSTRSGWSSYDNSAPNIKGDKDDSLNDKCKRSYCTKSTGQHQVLSKKEQLKKAFRDYGSTIVTFHIAVSLVSLGSFYLLISSGIDVIAQLENLGYAPEALKNNIAVGASNFVIAYAIHKIFAPIRISLTLGSAPFIVRYLRSKGLLKPKNVKQ